MNTVPATNIVMINKNTFIGLGNYIYKYNDHGDLQEKYMLLGNLMSITVFNNVIYFISSSIFLGCFDPGAGQVKWIKQLNLSGYSFSALVGVFQTGNTVFANQIMAVGTNGNTMLFCAVDPNSGLATMMHTQTIPSTYNVHISSISPMANDFGIGIAGDIFSSQVSLLLGFMRFTDYDPYVYTTMMKATFSSTVSQTVRSIAIVPCQNPAQLCATNNAIIVGSYLPDGVNRKAYMTFLINLYFYYPSNGICFLQNSDLFQVILTQNNQAFAVGNLQESASSFYNLMVVERSSTGQYSAVELTWIINNGQNVIGASIAVANQGLRISFLYTYKLNGQQIQNETTVYLSQNIQYSTAPDGYVWRNISNASFKQSCLPSNPTYTTFPRGIINNVSLTALQSVSVAFPSFLPTSRPTDAPILPTSYPSLIPTSWPTRFPTEFPTSVPTLAFGHTANPTSSQKPTRFPTTKNPTQLPTTKSPTGSPTTRSPTQSPTTKNPSYLPSQDPSISPSETPSCEPTTSVPTHKPHESLTFPTETPVQEPTFFPSFSPTAEFAYRAKKASAKTNWSFVYWASGVIVGLSFLCCITRCVSDRYENTKKSNSTPSQEQESVVLDALESNKEDRLIDSDDIDSGNIDDDPLITCYAFQRKDNKNDVEKNTSNSALKDDHPDISCHFFQENKRIKRSRIKNNRVEALEKPDVLTLREPPSQAQFGAG